MKLKEAQMLGVLALIAVGIILLCMWGGGSGSSEPKATATDNQTAAATSSPASGLDVAQLTNELLNAPADGSAAAGKDANVNMAVGGKTPAQPAGASDAAAVSAMIDRTAPDKIPLTQPKDGAKAAAAPTTSAAVATTTHVVRAGETLSTISRQVYGTKANWKLILDANSSVVKSATGLKPNMKLVIPAAKATTAKAVASESADAPSLLSATTFAPGVATAPAAASAPAGTAAAAIAPAATIAPAAASAHATAPTHASAAAPAPAVAIAPAVAFEPVAASAPAAASAAVAAPKPAAASAASSAAAASSGPRTHTVAKGDTLFRIALKYYGDGNRYKDVLAANRNVISNPSDLKVGMKLVIP